jgi:hypothetical protein
MLLTSHRPHLPAVGRLCPGATNSGETWESEFHCTRKILYSADKGISVYMGPRSPSQNPAMNRFDLELIFTTRGLILTLSSP